MQSSECLGAYLCWVNDAIIEGKKCEVTIVNCYLDSWQALAVEIVYFYGLITVFPCFLEVGRTRLLEYFYGKMEEKHFRVFNVAFMIVSTLFNFFSPFLPLDLIMSLVGSLLCFFFVYLIPTKFHWQCLYHNHHPTTLLTSSESDFVGCPHSENYVENWPKGVRKVFYAGINVIGVAVGIYGLYAFVDQMFFA